jgi:hypothetical protein
MKRWVTTSWIYRTFGQKTSVRRSDTKRWNQGIWEVTDYTPDFDNLKSALSIVTDYCNRNQYALKSLFPLTSAKSYEYGTLQEYSSLMEGVVAAAGIGQAWAFSNVIGFAAMLEKVEEISDEEFDRRSQNEHEASPALSPA